MQLFDLLAMRAVPEHLRVAVHDRAQLLENQRLGLMQRVLRGGVDPMKRQSISENFGLVHFVS